jgi:dihydrofolate reductase
VSPFSIIVAMDEKGGIGKDGDLPWKLSADMKYFRETTTGKGSNAVIMGRKTWDSIPEKYRPLPGRKNIVLSRQADFSLPEGTGLAHSLDEALGLAADSDEVFVIGGGSLYQEALKHGDCNAIFLTAVHATFDCDTFFLPDESQWNLRSESPVQEENGLRFCFCVYRG